MFNRRTILLPILIWLSTLEAYANSFTDLKDQSFEVRGPAVLNFWATWCSPCLKEMPDLDQVYQSLGPEKLIVLAVSMGESRERVRRFLKKRNYSFPIMTDPEMEITRLYGVRNIPITYLVDPSGVIIGRALGPREWSEPKLLKFFRSRMNRQAG